MEFQTHPKVCDYMVDLCRDWINDRIIWANTIKWLEPTPGQGNMVAAIERQYRQADIDITAPADFFDYLPGLLTGKVEYPRFDIIIANPPFTPIVHGWKYLQHFIQMSDFIVILLPWFIVINSKKRINAIIDFGLQSITHLPREVFPNSRIQCCILQMRKGYDDHTIFKTFDF